MSRAVFFVAGYDAANYFGRVFQLNLPGGVNELHPHAGVGLTFAGVSGIAEAVVSRITIPYSYIPVRGAANLARWLITLTIQAQGFGAVAEMPTVGGQPLIAVLERGKAVKII